MKCVFFLLIFLPGTILCKAQDTTWQSKFIVSQGENRDTVWFGISSAAKKGFQQGWDVLDTINYRDAGKSLIIRSHDEIIATNLNTDCGNLKKNFVGFAGDLGVVTFNFFIYYEYAGDIVYINWDSTDYKFNYGKLWLKSAVLTSQNSYLNWPDETVFVICNHPSQTENRFGYYGLDSIWIYSEGFFNGCREYALMHFTLEVGLKGLNVGIEENNLTQALNIYPNPVESGHLFNIKFQNNFSGHIIITDMNRRNILSKIVTNSTGYTEQLPHHLKPGFYNVRMINNQGNSFSQNLIIK